MLRFNLRYQVFLAISDALLVVVALFGSITLLKPKVASLSVEANTLQVVGMAIAVWLVVFARNQVYHARPGLRLLHTYNQLLNQHVIATFILMGLLYITLPSYPRHYVAAFSVILLVLLFVHRTVIHLLRRSLHPWINSVRRVMIIGDDEYAKKVGDYVHDCLPIGLELIGFVATDDDSRERCVEPILGTISEMGALLEKHVPDEVIFSTRWFDQTTTVQIEHLIKLVQNTPIHVRIAPDFSQLTYLRSTTESFNGLMLIGIREAVFSPLERIVKRGFDIVFSLLILMLTAPLYPIIALAIRLDSRGSIIFQQQRVGQYGKHFTIYKFRTMHDHAENEFDNKLPEARRYQKSPHDPRVTRVGRWLRRLSLDELPQFINVLRGDMSVVGPRPELVSIAESFSAWHRKRLEVPQGITGWWQINGRADYPLYYHIEDDLYYIENYSIWLDVLIILRTIIAVVQRRGAY